MKINSTKSEIENLLSQLSKTNNNLTQDFILKKIDELSNEISTLEKSFINEESKKELSNAALTNIDLVLNSFNEFSKLYETIKNLNIADDYSLTLALRSLIERIVSKITYDGNTKEVTIDIWGGNVHGR